MKHAFATAAVLLSTVAAASPATALEPFVASYEAWHGGRQAGTATMQVVERDASIAQWRVDLGIRGNRGFAGILGLNVEQSTVFDAWHGQYRPISQSTVRKAAFLNRRITGTYDWHARTAQWTGDGLSEWRRRSIPLEDGDMSGLLINLATVRDAEPGKVLRYRFVDGGRVRDHEYRVATETEPVTVGDMEYQAMRVERTHDGDGDETIFWIADGVPTPIRILQREDGEDSVDLRLVEYRGAQ
ncbi:MAG: DUF3108 domain-containing protein [Luteimonas sp.]|nr:DUF3108 domain-containing protein [Luteimonas sp.]